jgi:hypothetical protein
MRTSGFNRSSYMRTKPPPSPNTTISTSFLRLGTQTSMHLRTIYLACVGLRVF